MINLVSPCSEFLYLFFSQYPTNYNTVSRIQFLPCYGHSSQSGFFQYSNSWCVKLLKIKTQQTQSTKLCLPLNPSPPKFYWLYLPRYFLDSWQLCSRIIPLIHVLFIFFQKYYKDFLDFCTSSTEFSEELENRSNEAKPHWFGKEKQKGKNRKEKGKIERSQDILQNMQLHKVILKQRNQYVCSLNK